MYKEFLILNHLLNYNSLPEYFTHKEISKATGYPYDELCTLIANCTQEFDFSEMEQTLLNFFNSPFCMLTDPEGNIITADTLRSIYYETRKVPQELLNMLLQVKVDTPEHPYISDGVLHCTKPPKNLNAIFKVWACASPILTPRTFNIAFLHSDILTEEPLTSADLHSIISRVIASQYKFSELVKVFPNPVVDYSPIYLKTGMLIKLDPTLTTGLLITEKWTPISLPVPQLKRLDDDPFIFKGCYKDGNVLKFSDGNFIPLSYN